MRLSADQLQIIRKVVLATAGDRASTWLFGSRLALLQPTLPTTSPHSYELHWPKG